MMVIQAEGGLVAGAFLDGRLIAYVFGSPSSTLGVQHSHRLAVLSEARGRGIGLGTQVLPATLVPSRGIRQVRWTYDPMRAVNAALNIARLGARSSSYLINYFGAMGGINEGLPSDRLLVDWSLDTPASSQDRKAGSRLKSLRGAFEFSSLTRWRRCCYSDREKALKARLALRDSLREAFAGGHEINGFDCLDHTYILTRKGAE